MKVVQVNHGESPVFNKISGTKGLERKNGWVKVEICKVVAEWFLRPEDNLGLAVQVVDSFGRPVGISNSEQNESLVRLG